MGAPMMMARRSWCSQHRAWANDPRWLGIIVGSAKFAKLGVHPAFIVWMVLFSAATLFGCTALLIRF